MNCQYQDRLTVQINPSSPLAFPAPPLAVPGAAGTVLVCDDTPNNLCLLEDILGTAGYATMLFLRGDLALAAVARQPPDLILLDVKMPGLDGYEVCRRLKAQPAWAPIPVIFMSGLVAIDDKVRAFQVGGVDFLTQPLQFKEVLERVRVHLAQRQEHEALRRQCEQLKAELVARQAWSAQRDALLHLVVHELRTSLASVILAGQVMELENETGMAAGRQRSSQLAALLTAAGEFRELVNQLRDLESLENETVLRARTTARLPALAQQAIKWFECRAGECQVVLQVTPGVDFTVHAHARLTRRVIELLLDYALQASRSARRADITIDPVDGGVRLTIEHGGRSLPAAERARIFHQYLLGPNDYYVPGGHDVALSFCHLAITRQGGQIGVEDRAGGGSRFWFTLPATANLEPIPTAHPSQEGPARGHHPDGTWPNTAHQPPS